jgi:hypothetical protein
MSQRTQEQAPTRHPLHRRRYQSAGAWFAYRTWLPPREYSHPSLGYLLLKMLDFRDVSWTREDFEEN